MKNSSPASQPPSICKGRRSLDGAGEAVVATLLMPEFFETKISVNAGGRPELEGEMPPEVSILQVEHRRIRCSMRNARMNPFRRGPSRPGRPVWTVLSGEPREGQSPPRRSPCSQVAARSGVSAPGSVLEAL